MTRRVLLVEDDHFQADAIAEQIRKECQQSGVLGVIIEFCGTEYEAGREISRSIASGAPYDCYVVDLMLPWARGDVIPDPNLFDARIRADGGLKAGFRIIEHLRRLEAASGGPRRSAILCTVATILEQFNGHQNRFGYERLQKADEADTALAQRLAELLSVA